MHCQTHPHGNSVGARLDAGCLASARTWRREAESLRHQADNPCLTQRQRCTLLRDAETAEQQSDWWLDAIEEA
jgi:hypothetical protein